MDNTKLAIVPMVTWAEAAAMCAREAALAAAAASGRKREDFEVMHLDMITLAAAILFYGRGYTWHRCQEFTGISELALRKLQRLEHFEVDDRRHRPDKLCELFRYYIYK